MVFWGMGPLETARVAIDAIRAEIEDRYPLTLGVMTPELIEGDDGWRVDYVIAADRHGPMSLFELCDLEACIQERTGLAVLIDTRPVAEGLKDPVPAAAE
jgi:hypothetical protein